MSFLPLLLTLLFCPDTRAVEPEDGFVMSAVPLVGYHLGLSEFGATAEGPEGGYGLSQGPQVGIRLRADYGRFFLAPDLTALPLLGGGGTPLLWSLGFIAGTRLSYSGFDVYAGLAHKNFLSYPEGSGGAFFRIGAAFRIVEKSFQVFIEGISGSFRRNGATYEALCPYYGLEGGIQFPLPFEPPKALP